MNEETVMLCLQELKTDIKWIKRILTGMATLMLTLIGIMLGG